MIKRIYNKLANILCSIPSDKLIHKDISFIISFILIKAISPITGLTVSIIISNIITIGIDIYKEYLDSKGDNIFDKKDIIAGVIGSILGSLFSII